jgi:CDP-4-dehydro-6-deoxyglucose reductase
MNVAIIVDIIKETKSNWRFIFESPLYDKLDFVPGQLVQLAVPWNPKWGDGSEYLTRNYSVASWPDGSNRFELIVTNLIGGKMCDYLFNDAKIGDEVIYRGPMGVFTLPETIERDIYFVSTGSGISPFRSMLGYIAENKVPTKNLKLFFGTRKESDIPYYEEMKNYEKIIPNFEYIPCLSQEKWEGHNGYVHSAYLPIIDKMDEKPLIYFCGWDRMIREGRNHLSERGFEMMKDIRVEIFG